jgi:hypothetical protein
MDTMVCLAIPPKTISMEEAQRQVSDFKNVMLFDNEADMLDTFLDLIQEADVLSGWNSEGFDIPYTVNRVTKVLSKEDTRRFCLWNQFPKKREYEKYGKTAITYDFIGRVHLDSLELYRKYTYEERHTYRLDAIAEYELGQRKTQYEGTLDQLYNNDFKTFVEYNINDCQLLDDLDKKLKFMDLANTLAHKIEVPAAPPSAAELTLFIDAFPEKAPFDTLRALEDEIAARTPSLLEHLRKSSPKDVPEGTMDLGEVLFGRGYSALSASFALKPISGAWTVSTLGPASSKVLEVLLPKATFVVRGRR